MSVTLLEVWRAARARSVPFSGESAGFMALALCEATQSSPRSLALTDAELGEDGVVRLLSNRSCAEPLADKDLRTLLGRLLEVASSPGPSLFRVAGRGGGTSLATLAEEIEKALIPLNRGAARRALVRLFRETARAVEQGKLAPAPALDEPAQIRLSPPPSPVASRDAVSASAPVVAASHLVAASHESAPAPSVSPLLFVAAALETPPPAPALPIQIAEPRFEAESSRELPAVVAVSPLRVTPPSPTSGTANVRTPPPLPVSLASRERTMPLPVPVLGAEANKSLDPEPVEPEYLTSPQTVVARRARGLVGPPPLPDNRLPQERTPRMGSIDVAVISVPVAHLPPLPEAPGDATERVPPVMDAVEPLPSEDSLQALAEWPLPNGRPAPSAAASDLDELTRELPGVEPRPTTELSAPLMLSVNAVNEPEPVLDAPSPSLPRFALETELSPDPPTAEPPGLRESPALVVGVHVADSDDAAEPVLDDELETRPLPSSASALPVEPIRPILAPTSDVRELLSEFQVRDGLSEVELRRELKALAGVDLTPGSAVDVGPR
ncbi:MAG: hypothetical protein ACOY0T_23715 [Myxococcota bacterium]